MPCFTSAVSRHWRLITTQRPGVDPQSRSDHFAQLAGVEGPGAALAQLPQDIGQIGFLKALAFARRGGAGRQEHCLGCGIFAGDAAENLEISGQRARDLSFEPCLGFRRDDQLFPPHLAVGRMQGRHATHHPRHRDTGGIATRNGTRQEIDRAGLAGRGVMHDADTAPAKPNTGRQSDGHGKSHGGRGIDRVAALRQNIAPDRSRSGLIRSDAGIDLMGPKAYRLIGGATGKCCGGHGNNAQPLPDLRIS